MTTSASLLVTGAILCLSAPAFATEKVHRAKCGANITLNDRITHNYRVEIRKLKDCQCNSVLIACNGANSKELPETGPIQYDCDGTTDVPGFVIVSCVPFPPNGECVFATEIVP